MIRQSYRQPDFLSKINRNNIIRQTNFQSWKNTKSSWNRFYICIRSRFRGPVRKIAFTCHVQLNNLPLSIWDQSETLSTHAESGYEFGSVFILLEIKTPRIFVFYAFLDLFIRKLSWAFNNICAKCFSQMFCLLIGIFEALYWGENPWVRWVSNGEDIHFLAILSLISIYSTPSPIRNVRFEK